MDSNGYPYEILDFTDFRPSLSFRLRHHFVTVRDIRIFGVGISEFLAQYCLIDSQKQHHAGMARNVFKEILDSTALNHGSHSKESFYQGWDCERLLRRSFSSEW
jgi:hypothetical protein